VARRVLAGRGDRALAQQLGQVVDVRISAIVDADFSVIADGVSA